MQQHYYQDSIDLQNNKCWNRLYWLAAPPFLWIPSAQTEPICIGGYPLVALILYMEKSHFLQHQRKLIKVFSLIIYIVNYS